MRWLSVLLVLIPLPALAEGGAAVVELQGMDCAGCASQVAVALEELPFVGEVQASFSEGSACIELTGALDEAAVRKAVDNGEVTAASIEAVERCPETRRHPAARDPWAEPGEVDARIVSRGDKIDLDEILVEGHYTVVDFGAPWCGPCHTAAETLKGYLAAHDDVAVRAISLDAPDAKASFGLPVAKQHLGNVPGIPWFLVYDARGKRIYRGAEVDEVIAAIDARRAK